MARNWLTGDGGGQAPRSARVSRRAGRVPVVEFPAEPDGWKPGLTEEEVDLYEHPAEQEVTRPSQVGSPKG